MMSERLFQGADPSWKFMSLEDVCENIFDCPHSTPKLVEKSSYYMVRTQDVRSGFFDRTNAVFLSKETYIERTQRAKPKYGDILLSREGTYFGDAAEVPDDIDLCLGQRMVLLRPKRELINSSFLRIWINSPDFQRYLLGFRDGTVAERLNVSTIRKLPIPVPTIAQQEEIIAQIVPLECKQSVNRKMNATLEAMAQALFKSWFVDFDPVLDNALAAGNPIPDELEAKAAARQALGDARKPLPEDICSLFPNAFVFTEEMGWIPEGWKIGCLADIAKHIQSNVKAEEIQDSDLYVGLEHIGRQRLFLENADYGDKVVSNKSRFNKLDILFGKLRPYFHKVCLAPESGICSTDILVFRPKKKYLQSLLTMVLYSEPLVEYANLRSTGTRMPRASSKDMLAYPFVKIPEKIAEYFDVILSPYWEKGIAINTEKQSLEQLRDTLLPKLLSGELRIPEAEELVEEAIA